MGVCSRRFSRFKHVVEYLDQLFSLGTTSLNLPDTQFSSLLTIYFTDSMLNIWTKFPVLAKHRRIFQIPSFSFLLNIYFTDSMFLHHTCHRLCAHFVVLSPFSVISPQGFISLFLMTISNFAGSAGPRGQSSPLPEPAVPCCPGTAVVWQGGKKVWGASNDSVLVSE